MSLFKTWEDAHIKNTLPPEWRTWGECRAWAIANGYKIEYGYKGEFTPEGCLKAMPGYKDGLDAGAVIVDEIAPDFDKYEIVGIDLAGGPDETAIAETPKPEKKGGADNARKKTNPRSRSRNSV